MVPSTPPESPSTVTMQETVTASDGERPRDASEPLHVGQSFGRYVVLGRAGRGGMGVVYSAYDAVLDRRVALKLLLTEPSSEQDGREARARLLREAQALAKLSHPNVVTVHDAGDVDGTIYLAMEYVGAYLA
jgi:serine/threonine protein kinase